MDAARVKDGETRLKFGVPPPLPSPLTSPASFSSVLRRNHALDHDASCQCHSDSPDQAGSISLRVLNCASPQSS